MLLSEIKAIFHSELDLLYPAEEVDAFFYRMVEHYLDLQRFVLVVQPALTLSKKEEQPLFKGLARLKNEEPIQYILGETHFRDVILKVNKNVLIPRPETEELVSWIIEEYQQSQDKGLTILDIGTGSGCIAITLAKEFPAAKTVALDVSGKALAVAKGNAELHGVQIAFVKSNILELGYHPDAKFDVIVSNPPYVRDSEKPGLRNNVKAYEPEEALFVPDKDPLLYYKAITKFAGEHLKTGGNLFLEINQYLGKATLALLQEEDFTKIELKKDIFGKDRMIKALK